LSKFDFVECPWNDQAQNSTLNASCGIALILQRRYYSKQFIKDVFLPTDPLLLGRVAAIRLKRAGVYDTTFVNAYMPLTYNQTGRDAYLAILHWLSELLQQLPARTLPILCADFNAHLGLPALCFQIQVFAAYPYHRQDNWAGTQFRRFLLENQLFVTNTSSPRCSCPTWFGAHSATQVDFICIPYSAYHRVFRVQV
jgi:hypothetical protein